MNKKIQKLNTEVLKSNKQLINQTMKDVKKQLNIKQAINQSNNNSKQSITHIHEQVKQTNQSNSTNN